jgi:hypothetical protein
LTGVSRRHQWQSRQPCFISRRWPIGRAPTPARPLTLERAKQIPFPPYCFGRIRRKNSHVGTALMPPTAPLR